MTVILANLRFELMRLVVYWTDLSERTKLRCSHDKRGQTLPLPEWRTPSDDSLRAAGVGA